MMSPTLWTSFPPLSLLVSAPRQTRGPLWSKSEPPQRTIGELVLPGRQSVGMSGRSRVTGGESVIQ